MEANSFEQPAFNLVVAETQLIYELTYTHGVLFAAAFRLEHCAAVAAALAALEVGGDIPAD